MWHWICNLVYCQLEMCWLMENTRLQGCAPKLDVIEKSPRLGVMSYKGKDQRSLQIAVVPR